MMKRLALKLLSLLILTSLLVLMLPSPAQAIANPTSQTVNAVYVYQNLLETGDVGVMVDYTITYGALPTENVTAAYLVIFIDTDGTTQLRSVAPYAYSTLGYGRGIAWIYFSAADVATYSLSSTNMALYRVWLTGNPTLTWTGPATPPKTIATISLWQTTGDQKVILAQRIITEAAILGPLWSLTLYENTPLGNRLTTTGEAYFTQAIPNCQLLAPSAFASGTIVPTNEGLNYLTSFGGTAATGTAVVAGSPQTLVSGANTVAVGGNGTVIVTLNKGTSGSATNGTTTVAGPPVALVAGTNTVTVTGGAGNFIVTVALSNTQTTITSGITGTGFDLSAPAAAFGMSTMMFSSLVWLVLTVCICAAVYGKRSQTNPYDTATNGKITLVIFDLCIIGGAVLGLFSLLVLALLVICFGGLTGYVIFFRGANV